MFTCKETEKLIDLYIDQELDSETRENLQEHLRQCSRCKALLESKEQETEKICAGFPVPELEVGFSKNVINRVSKKSPFSEPRKFLKVPVFAATLLLFVMIGVYFVGSPDLLSEESVAPDQTIFEPNNNGNVALQKSNNPSEESEPLHSIRTGAPPKFRPAYLPRGFVLAQGPIREAEDKTLEKDSLQGDMADGKEAQAEKPVISTYHNPQTKKYINIEIIENPGKQTTEITDESRNVEQEYGVSLVVERYNRIYLVKVSGNISVEELKKVMDSI